MAELFGRADGCAHGRGGSMHLLDVDARLLRRLGHRRRPAARRDRPRARARAPGRAGRRSLCELGDGAVNMGAWHESLNLAALWQPADRLPRRQQRLRHGHRASTRASAEPELYKRAAAYRMHGERVDGDDLDAVIEASDRLLRGARATSARPPCSRP